jgi:hypothetical protein
MQLKELQSPLSPVFKMEGDPYSRAYEQSDHTRSSVKHGSRIASSYASSANDTAPQRTSNLVALKTTRAKPKARVLRRMQSAQNMREATTAPARKAILQSTILSDDESFGSSLLGIPPPPQIYPGSSPVDIKKTQTGRKVLDSTASLRDVYAGYFLGEQSASRLGAHSKSGSEPNALHVRDNDFTVSSNGKKPRDLVHRGQATNEFERHRIAGNAFAQASGLSNSSLDQEQPTLERKVLKPAALDLEKVRLPSRLRGIEILQNGNSRQGFEMLESQKKKSSDFQPRSSSRVIQSQQSRNDSISAQPTPNVLTYGAHSTSATTTSQNLGGLHHECKSHDIPPLLREHTTPSKPSRVNRESGTHSRQVSRDTPQKALQLLGLSRENIHPSKAARVLGAESVNMSNFGNDKYEDPLSSDSIFDPLSGGQIGSYTAGNQMSGEEKRTFDSSSSKLRVPKPISMDSTSSQRLATGSSPVSKTLGTMASKPNTLITTPVTDPALKAKQRLGIFGGTALERKQSLKYLDDSTPPTPPEKDTLYLKRETKDDSKPAFVRGKGRFAGSRSLENPRPHVGTIFKKTEVIRGGVLKVPSSVMGMDVQEGANVRSGRTNVIHKKSIRSMYVAIEETSSPIPVKESVIGLGITLDDENGEKRLDTDMEVKRDPHKIPGGESAGCHDTQQKGPINLKDVAPRGESVNKQIASTDSLGGRTLQCYSPSLYTAHDQEVHEVEELPSYNHISASLEANRVIAASEKTNMDTEVDGMSKVTHDQDKNTMGSANEPSKSSLEVTGVEGSPQMGSNHSNADLYNQPSAFPTPLFGRRARYLNASSFVTPGQSNTRHNSNTSLKNDDNAGLVNVPSFVTPGMSSARQTFNPISLKMGVTSTPPKHHDKTGGLDDSQVSFMSRPVDESTPQNLHHPPKAMILPPFAPNFNLSGTSDGFPLIPPEDLLTHFDISNHHTSTIGESIHSHVEGVKNEVVSNVKQLRKSHANSVVKLNEQFDNLQAALARQWMQNEELKRELWRRQLGNGGGGSKASVSMGGTRALFNSEENSSPSNESDGYNPVDSFENEEFGKQTTKVEGSQTEREDVLGAIKEAVTVELKSFARTVQESFVDKLDKALVGNTELTKALVDKMSRVERLEGEIGMMSRRLGILIAILNERDDDQQDQQSFGLLDGTGNQEKHSGPQGQVVDADIGIALGSPNATRHVSSPTTEADTLNTGNSARSGPGEKVPVYMDDRPPNESLTPYLAPDTLPPHGPRAASSALDLNQAPEVGHNFNGHQMHRGAPLVQYQQQLHSMTSLPSMQSYTTNSPLNGIGHQIITPLGDPPASSTRGILSIHPHIDNDVAGVMQYHHRNQQHARRGNA